MIEISAKFATAQAFFREFLMRLLHNFLKNSRPIYFQGKLITKHKLLDCCLYLYSHSLFRTIFTSVRHLNINMIMQSQNLMNQRNRVTKRNVLRHQYS